MEKPETSGIAKSHPTHLKILVVVRDVNNILWYKRFDEKTARTWPLIEIS